MKRSKGTRNVAATALLILSAVAAYATEGVVVADTYVNSAHPTTNYGTLSNLFVNSNGTTLIQLDLSSLPAGTTASQIGAASLKLYVNRINTSGLISIIPVTSPWGEYTATFATQPALGSTVAWFTPAVAQQFIVVDVTAQVQSWLNGAANDGIALTTSSADVVFDSKENDETGHAAYLDITLISQGPQGPSGSAATVSVGTTATGTPGSNASVTNAGTSSAAVFNFTIPAGATGEQGPQGPAGLGGGAWTSGTSYAAGSVVSDHGNLFIATSENTASSGNEPGISGGASAWAGMSPGSSFAWTESFINSQDTNPNYLAPTGFQSLSTVYSEDAGDGVVYSPASCTIRSLTVHQIYEASSAGSGSESTTITLRHNGSNTSVSCSINGLSSGTGSCTSTNSVFVASGDTLEYKVTQNNVNPFVMTTPLLVCN